MKATDRIRLLRKSKLIACKVLSSDLAYWLAEKQPVILVLYDATKDCAFWVYIQAYFEAIRGFQLSQMGKSTTVQMLASNVLDESAIRRFISYRDDVESQRQGKVKHHA